MKLAVAQTITFGMFCWGGEAREGVKEEVKEDDIYLKFLNFF